MTSTPNAGPELEDASRRVQELSDRLLDLSKQNGLAWLEAYERVLESMLRLEQQVAQGSQIEWVNTLATTHADFVREMSRVYLGALRNPLVSSTSGSPQGQPQEQPQEQAQEQPEEQPQEQPEEQPPSKPRSRARSKPRS